MLYGISYTSKPGKESELEALLSSREFALRIARLTGASHEAVLEQGNRFTQLFDLPGQDEAHTRERVLQAHAAPEMRDLLRRLAPLLSDPFDPDDPTSITAFVRRHRARVILDARRRPAEKGQARGQAQAQAQVAKPSSAAPAMPAAPR